jgi:mannose-1-phosphate guanylyltransferase
MSDRGVTKAKPWCIVVADDHGPEYVPWMAGSAKTSPVQYCGFGEPTTLLQRALHRAKQIAPSAQIVVTVREENRERWEPALWFIRPEHCFVSDSRMTAPLTTAAALLSIAADSFANVVTVLPARCYVANESILVAALNQLQAMLPRIPEGAGTLGMIDIEDGIDEDYLVPFDTRVGPGQAVQAVARRPVEWVARHLRRHGAMVASGILTGYARVFAMHATRRWPPEFTRKLTKVMQVAANGEKRLYVDGHREMTRSVLRSLRWWPPTFPQRALRVHQCGFRGLQTARAARRISESCPTTIDSVAQYGAAADFELWQSPRANPSGNVDYVANRPSLQCADSSVACGSKPPRRCVDHGWVD